MWAVVLAGGQGVRLRGLTRHVYGVERPKQYAALMGGISLLRQTLARVRLRVPPERTLVVTMTGQAGYMATELKREQRAPMVLEQPAYRGTAAAVLLAAHWIRARDPKGALMFLPSDHFVEDDAAFMDAVVGVVRAIEQGQRQIVLLGAEPADPETDYGWIDLGKPLPGIRSSSPMHRVLRFIEKPDQAEANELYRAGALWNTFVFGGRAAALVEAGAEYQPALHERLSMLDKFLGSEHERWAIAQAYEFAPRASFSRDVLEHCPSRLAAMRLAQVGWCDLGTPRRVIRLLDQLDVKPDWLATLRETG